MRSGFFNSWYAAGTDEIIQIFFLEAQWGFCFVTQPGVCDTTLLNCPLVGNQRTYVKIPYSYVAS